MSQFKKGRGGKLVLEQTPEEKAAAFEYIKARNEEKTKAAEAKAEKKRILKEEEMNRRKEAKLKEKNILEKIAAASAAANAAKVNPEAAAKVNPKEQEEAAANAAKVNPEAAAKGNPDATAKDDPEEKDEIHVATKEPKPKVKKTGGVGRYQTSATVENVNWNFDEKNKDCIYRYPGQMVIPKTFVKNQEKFRTFFSPSDQDNKGMAFKGYVDPTKITLYRESPTHYYVPDFAESFTNNTDLSYDLQQTALRSLFKDSTIPTIKRISSEFYPHEVLLPLSDIIKDTGETDEDNNVIYSHGSLSLKSEQVVTLQIVHEYFSKKQNRRILLKLGTGVGKTFTALLIAKMINTDSKIAIIINTKNQIDYWYSEIEKIFPGEVVMDYDYKSKKFVEKFSKAKFFIFSQQSAAYTEEKIFSQYKYSDDEKNEVIENLENWYAQFGVVLVDECHEMCSDTRRPFATNFRNAYVIGLSATPDLKETVKRITFLYYGNVISASKLLLYASKKGVALKPTVYEYETIYKIVNYLSYPVYTEIDDCVKGHISMRKEEVPLPQCLTAKINADIHRVYMLAHITLETALEGRCTILLCKTVDYLYMIRDAIQRLINGEKPIMLHDPKEVFKFKSFNPDYPHYLSKVVLPNGKCKEVDSITLRYRSDTTDGTEIIKLGGEESTKRYGHLRDDPMYNNPIIINSKYKGDWNENSVTEAIGNTNIILSTVQSLGTGYNIKKANTIIMAHSVIMAYEQCVGRIKRDTTGMDRHGYDIVDSGCGVFKAQYKKRYKRFYCNNNDNTELHFYDADDIIFDSVPNKKDNSKKTRTRLAAGEAPKAVSVKVEEKENDDTLIDLPPLLVNYKATIDVVPQASKMERLKKLANVLEEDEELDAWGE